ncbi:MAG: PrsW family intramembrane metalloprotease [Anaerolineales bacterium]|nr:MAG: PrsW family intramembrane metalloprotease [Anaerolineales bacterium]
MKAYAWLKMAPLALMAFVVTTLGSPRGMVFAQDELSLEDAQLARRYAPVLYFHPAELFRPQSVDVLVNTARLRQARRNWFDVNVLLSVPITDLFDYRDDSYALDAWYGDEGASDYKNYSAHRAYYQTVLSSEAGGPPIVTYAHVVRDEDPQHITIQYWLFYYYNDWFNKHEGDWEMVQVVLSAAGEPGWVVLSQHHGGTRRPWSAAQIEEGTHPAVYVALGSHANYFWGDETYPNGRTIGNTRVEIMDRTGMAGRIVPEVILIPGREEVEADPVGWRGLEWLPFAGHWGELAPQSDFGGPLGPADKGDQWERPYAWGLAQPLDVDTWYANRLRVAVTGEAAQDAIVTLQVAGGNALPWAETHGGVALLHTDPSPGAVIVADIQARPGLLYDLVASWPDVKTSRVTHYRFDDVPAGASGRASLTLSAGGPPVLIVAGAAQEIRPTSIEEEAVTWDAPDLVWVAEILPAPEVVRGVSLSLLASLLPALFYVGAIYWADRYEKEPRRLLAAAFFWGAIPALLVAIVVRLFFRLPVDLLGPEAVEAVRVGLAAPLVEETLKGVAVLYIALRYRLEFDNVLDGIIYGALVGLGFATTGNTLSYVGAFLLRGFSGLGSTIFIEGVLYGLNHAFYSALFGAGLGYARLARSRWQRWSIPLAAFVLAVASHALHNLVIRSAVGLNLLTVALTWVGVLLMVVLMCWSLRRQQRCLVIELVGEVPDEVYRTLITWEGRMRARWQAFRTEGLRGWRRREHVHQQCAELAFKKMQHQRRPDEPGLLEEVVRLRKQVRALVEGGS